MGVKKKMRMMGEWWGRGEMKGERGVLQGEGDDVFGEVRGEARG